MLQLQRLLQTVVNSYTSKEITTATSKPSTETATTIDIRENATTMDTAIRIIGRIEKIYAHLFLPNLYNKVPVNSLLII